MPFSMGCAVWAHKGWLGELFPEGARAADFLSLYSRRFTTVEGNTTFYMEPSRDMLARWAAETPPGFEFCLKLPRNLTHAGKLAPAIAPAARFLEHVRALGDRLGPIFAQLPPTYGPSDLEDLVAFLKAWPRSESPLALEVRHPDWFCEPAAGRLQAALSELGVGRVLLDSRPVYEGPGDPQASSPRKKPRVPVRPIRTAPFSLIRFISHPVLDENRRFLEPWVTCVDRWARAGARVYFFVHCPTEARSPANARLFQEMLEQAGAPVPKLPWSAIEQPASQLRLF